LISVKQIQVTCAIIEQNGLVLAAQRSAVSSMPLQWEFPGGKIHPGETPEDCLRRELVEELGIDIGIRQALPIARHRYPGFIITLYPFICVIQSGEPILREHAAVQWLKPGDLASLNWSEADIAVLHSYLSLYGFPKTGT
jgi:8-oxo-dGTP diphosphatase